MKFCNNFSENKIRRKISLRDKYDQRSATDIKTIFEKKMFWFYKTIFFDLIQNFISDNKFSKTMIIPNKNNIQTSAKVELDWTLAKQDRRIFCCFILAKQSYQKQKVKAYIAIIKARFFQFILISFSFRSFSNIDYSIELFIIELINKQKIGIDLGDIKSSIQLTQSLKLLTIRKIIISFFGRMQKGWTSTQFIYSTVINMKNAILNTNKDKKKYKRVIDDEINICP